MMILMGLQWNWSFMEKAKVMLKRKNNPTNTIMKFGEFEDISAHTNQLLDQPHPT